MMKSHFSKVLYFIFLFFIFHLNIFAQENSFSDQIDTMSVNCYASQIPKQLILPNFSFSKVQDNRINFGFSSTGYKCIFLKIQSRKFIINKNLVIENTSLDSVFIYRIYDKHKWKLLYSGGNLIAYNESRNYVWHTTPIQIGINPTYYLIAMKTLQKNINVQYEIISEKKLQEKYIDSERIVFFYLGTVSLITIAVTLAFFLFKEKVFAAYAGYIVSLSVWIFAHYGRVFPSIYPQMPIINKVIKPASSLGAVFFLNMVLRFLFHGALQYNQRYKKILYVIQCVLGLLVCMMFLLLILNLPVVLKIYLVAIWHIGLILSVVITVFTPFYFIRSGPSAKIFSSAIVIICLLAVLQIVGNLGFVNHYFLNEHGMTIGSLLEISIMAFGLFYGLLIEKKQRRLHVLQLEKEQTETLKKLIAVQDNERKRIAGDLHDNIGPLLAALKINFRRIIQTKENDVQNKLVAKTESIIDDSIAEIRNVAHNLMPKGLSSKGLIKTLIEYFESIEQVYNKPVVFRHDIQSIPNTELQINLYRIICELVLNAAKHSNASQITIRIIAKENFLSVIVEDNGRGFLVSTAKQRTSLGLQNAKDRVLYMKGKFQLRTSPGEGAHIEIEIPL